VTQWRVRGSRSLYESDTLGLELADVELTDGTRIEHHVIRTAFELAAVVVRDAERVLLLHRHRFIVDRWSWDVPTGKIAAGERPEEAAARACVEETGWRPHAVRLLGTYHPLPGISDQRVHVCAARGAEQVGEANVNECDRVEWVPVDRVRELELDGPTLTALLWAIA
jgi:8-oxo-dGTP pyrophosphatase MutT (NUDIX family)